MIELKPQNLRQRLARKDLLVAPGVFDGISVRIADQMGFEALYMTGYGTVASHLGLPDAGIATYSDMVGRVTVIAGGTRSPLIADGDTGALGANGAEVQGCARGLLAKAVHRSPIDEDVAIPQRFLSRKRSISGLS